VLGVDVVAEGWPCCVLVGVHADNASMASSIAIAITAGIVHLLMYASRSFQMPGTSAVYALGRGALRGGRSGRKTRDDGRHGGRPMSAQRGRIPNRCSI
jgi:hypothetical protein